MYSNQNGYYR